MDSDYPGKPLILGGLVPQRAVSEAIIRLVSWRLPLLRARLIVTATPKPRNQRRGGC